MAWSTYAPPAQWVASWSEDATNITIPIASIPEITAAEADGTTGDMRKCIYAILAQAFSAWNGFTDASKPEMMEIGCEHALIDATTIRRSYRLTFRVDKDTHAILPEPT